LSKTRRVYQRSMMRKVRAEKKDLEIPKVNAAAKRRRKKYRHDPEGFCRYYFSEIFYNDFTADQRDLIKAITDRIRRGGWKAHAATRGDGKSSITRVIGGAYAVVYGLIRYIVIVQANGPAAEQALNEIKEYYEANPLLQNDFPEVCFPIMALEGANQKAKTQTVAGERTFLTWKDKAIRFPRVKGSAASGIVVTTRGIDSPIRGLVSGNFRPDLVILDDIETGESAASIAQMNARERTIEKDIYPLAGPGKKIALVLLCTIIRSGCLADKYTDRKIMPAWFGDRKKFLISEPTNIDLWDKYIELRRTDQLGGDPFGRNAHRYYFKNRKKMHDGAKVNNPYRYRRIQLQDGTLEEISALEHAYNLICDMGIDTFQTEYQNNPPDELSAEGSGISVQAVCKKVNGLPRGIIPTWSECVTAYIDIHGRLLYWVIAAWRKGAYGVVIDYGTAPVYSPTEGRLTATDNIRGVQEAIFNSLLEWATWEADNGYPLADSDNINHVDLCLIDSGWMSDPVYKFVATRGSKFRASKGFGTGSQMNRYRSPSKNTPAGLRGAHWHAGRIPKERLYLYSLDSDYYKNAVHSGLLTPAEHMQSITLFGSEPVLHRTFAEQICAEVWKKQFTTGRGWREGFHVASRHNHYLDCLAGAYAAANMLGISPLGSDKIVKPVRARQLKFSELQRQKREKRARYG